MDMDEGEVRGRLRFTGELTIRVPEGEVTLTSLEVEAQGGLRQPKGRVAMTLVGPLREVRKLAGLAPAVADLLAHVKEEDAAQVGEITLVATPALVERLRAAGEAFDGEPMGEELFQNEPYVAALFSLLEYVPEKVSIITATWTE
jgi:hypothetical protein